MSSTSLTFGFDNVSVRVVLDEKGEPWFVAKDVCDVLGILNRNDAVARLRDVQKGIGSTDTLGGRQEMVTVSESGLYSLIFTSRKEAAQRFQEWVTDEVLPSIRKTGSYSTEPKKPKSEVEGITAALLLLGAAVQKVPGVKPGIAMAQTLATIKTNTGLDVSEMRLALPSAEKPFDGLNATNLGKRIGLSAVATNKQLYERGLQMKNARGEWELTTAGMQYGEAVPYSRHGHAGYQIMWQADVLDLSN